VDPNSPSADPQRQEEFFGAICNLQGDFQACLGLLKDLPEHEKIKGFDCMASALAPVLCLMMTRMSEQEFAIFVEVFSYALLRHPLADKVMAQFRDAMKSRGVTEYKEDREVKPRRTDRTDEAIRLRAEGKSWRDVIREIRSRPEWAEGTKGHRLTIKALQMAVRRRQKELGR
jgi:hypothetical protein